MTTIRLDPGDATTIAASHEDGGSTIDGAGSTAPGSVDGGEGGQYLHGILAAVSATGADLATLGNLAGAQVRSASDDFQGTDAAVGDAFRDMTDAAR